MTGCEHAVEYVYRYIDKELTFWRRVRIKIHLKRCGHCNSAVEFEEAFKARVAESGKSQPPVELSDTLRALILQERNSGNSRR